MKHRSVRVEVEFDEVDGEPSRDDIRQALQAFLEGGEVMGLCGNERGYRLVISGISQWKARGEK